MAKNFDHTLLDWWEGLEIWYNLYLSSGSGIKTLALV